MEHLDHEMAILNQQRLREGLEEQERNRPPVSSHLEKIQDCISELETSGALTNGCWNGVSPEQHPISPRLGIQSPKKDC